MAMPRRGSRRIVVDGVPFRWRVRAQPTYSQLLGWTPLTVGVEPVDGGSVLVLVFAGVRPDAALGAAEVATPARVAEAIRGARAAGWVLDMGGTLFFDVAASTLGRSRPQ